MPNGVSTVERQLLGELPFEVGPLTLTITNGEELLNELAHHAAAFTESGTWPTAGEVAACDCGTSSIRFITRIVRFAGLPPLLGHGAAAILDGIADGMVGRGGSVTRQLNQLLGAGRACPPGVALEPCIDSDECYWARNIKLSFDLKTPLGALPIRLWIDIGVCVTDKYFNFVRLGPAIKGPDDKPPVVPPPATPPTGPPSQPPTEPPSGEEELPPPKLGPRRNSGMPPRSTSPGSGPPDLPPPEIRRRRARPGDPGFPLVGGAQPDAPAGVQPGAMARTPRGTMGDGIVDASLLGDVEPLLLDVMLRLVEPIRAGGGNGDSHGGCGPGGCSGA